MNTDAGNSAYNDLQFIHRQLVAGDPMAIDHLYRQYFHRLLYFGIQSVSPAAADQVEDVIQDFFLWLSQHVEKLQKVQNLEAYLFQSIRRNLHSRIGRQQGEQQRKAKVANQQVKIADSPEFTHIQHEEGQHRQALIRTALSQLPGSQREAIYLRYFEDKSYDEIAEILSVSHQVAYNYVSRGIKRLRLQLGALVFVMVLGFGLIGLI